jgi:hypothetical protein
VIGRSVVRSSPSLIEGFDRLVAARERPALLTVKLVELVPVGRPLLCVLFCLCTLLLHILYGSFEFNLLNNLCEFRLLQLLVCAIEVGLNVSGF